MGIISGFIRFAPPVVTMQIGQIPQAKEESDTEKLTRARLEVGKRYTNLLTIFGNNPLGGNRDLAGKEMKALSEKDFDDLTKLKEEVKKLEASLKTPKDKQSFFPPDWTLPENNTIMWLNSQRQGGELIRTRFLGEIDKLEGNVVNTSIAYQMVEVVLSLHGEKKLLDDVKKVYDDKKADEIFKIISDKEGIGFHNKLADLTTEAGDLQEAKDAYRKKIASGASEEEIKKAFADVTSKEDKLEKSKNSLLKEIKTKVSTFLESRKDSPEVKKSMEVLDEKVKLLKDSKDRERFLKKRFEFLGSIPGVRNIEVAEKILIDEVKVKSKQ